MELMDRGMQRSNRTTKSKWIVPDSTTSFEMAELDAWEDNIIWGPSEACVSFASCAAAFLTWTSSADLLRRSRHLSLLGTPNSNAATGSRASSGTRTGRTRTSRSST